MGNDMGKITAAVVNQASGGFLDFVKVVVKVGVESALDEKIRDFTNHLKENKISEDEILEYIENMAQWEKDIFFTIIQKTILSEHPIKRFLLAKIWLYQIKHDELDYFHLTLLSNIDLLIPQDYKMIYDIVDQQSTLQSEKIIIRDYKSINEEFDFTISKLKSIGLMYDYLELPTVEEMEDQYDKVGTDNYKPKKHEDITYGISKKFHTLNNYVRDFYKQEHSKT